VTVAARDRAALLGAVLLVLAAGRPVTAQAPRQLELGIESFNYRSAETALNRDDVLGFDRYAGLLRAVLGWRETHGAFRAVFRGYVEQNYGTRQDELSWVARQAYAQYWWGDKLGVRLGKQRIAWGSGFAWNPTDRLEPAKNALNTTFEREGALGARLDWVPSARTSVVLVGAQTDANPRDLPVAATNVQRRAGAVRARVLVSNTDLALVLSAGKNQRSLVGFDVGRDLGGSLSLHAESSLYRGAEMWPPRDGELFFRIVVGGLRTSGTNAFVLEYFYNGEGYSATQFHRWLSGLDASWAAASDPALPPPAQQAALAAYAFGVSVPYSAGLGLRRQYLHASWTRGSPTSVWTGGVSSVVGLSDGGVALSPGVGFAPRGNVTLNLDGVLLLGPVDSEFRLRPLQGALQARLKVLF